VCTALAVQWGTTAETLATHVAEGHIFADYAKPWDVAIDSLQKLNAIVEHEGYGTRIWRVAEGTLDLHQAYREQSTDRTRRSPAQHEAQARLWALGPQLHPDDVAQWITSSVSFAIPGRQHLFPEHHVPLSRYRVLRDLWYALDLFHGQAERDAFLCFLEAEAPQRAASAETWDMLRRARQGDGANAPPCFRALGLAWPCTEEDVKHAYRTLAYAAHPDTGGSDTAFQMLAEAYELAMKYLEQHQKKDV
jgi:hypothetical protein